MARYVWVLMVFIVDLIFLVRICLMVFVVICIDMVSFLWVVLFSCLRMWLVFCSRLGGLFMLMRTWRNALVCRCCLMECSLLWLVSPLFVFTRIVLGGRLSSSCITIICLGCSMLWWRTSSWIDLFDRFMYVLGNVNVIWWLVSVILVVMVCFLERDSVVSARRVSLMIVLVFMLCWVCSYSAFGLFSFMMRVLVGVFCCLLLKRLTVGGLGFGGGGVFGGLVGGCCAAGYDDCDYGGFGVDCG